MISHGSLESSHDNTKEQRRVEDGGVNAGFWALFNGPEAHGVTVAPA